MAFTLRLSSTYRGSRNILHEMLGLGYIVFCHADSPIDSTVNQLFRDNDAIILPVRLRKRRDTANGFTKEAVCHRKNIRFMDDGEMLGASMRQQNHEQNV